LGYEDHSVLGVIIFVDIWHTVELLITKLSTLSIVKREQRVVLKEIVPAARLNGQIPDAINSPYDKAFSSNYLMLNTLRLDRHGRGNALLNNDVVSLDSALITCSPILGEWERVVLLVYLSLFARIELLIWQNLLQNEKSPT